MQAAASSVTVPPTALLIMQVTIMLPTATSGAAWSDNMVCLGVWYARTDHAAMGAAIMFCRLVSVVVFLGDDLNDFSSCQPN